MHKSKDLSLPVGLVTLGDAARAIGKTRATVGRWVSAGTLPACRVGSCWLVRLADAERVSESIRIGRPAGTRGAA